MFSVVSCNFLINCLVVIDRSLSSGTQVPGSVKFLEGLINVPGVWPSSSKKSLNLIDLINFCSAVCICEKFILCTVGMKERPRSRRAVSSGLSACLDKFIVYPVFWGLGLGLVLGLL